MNELRVIDAFGTVLALVFAGISVETACQEAGISPASYYRWLSTTPEAIKDLRIELMEQKRLQLVQVAAAQSQLMTQMIEKASGSNAGIYEKLSALGYLEHKTKDLENSVGIVADADDEAANFLNETMPLKHMESRMTTLNFKVKQDGSLDVSLPVQQGQVIEGEAQDPTPEIPEQTQ